MSAIYLGLVTIALCIREAAGLPSAGKGALQVIGCLFFLFLIMDVIKLAKGDK